MKAEHVVVRAATKRGAAREKNMTALMCLSVSEVWISDEEGRIPGQLSALYFLGVCWSEKLLFIRRFPLPLPSGLSGGWMYRDKLSPRAESPN